MIVDIKTARAIFTKELIGLILNKNQNKAIPMSNESKPIEISKELARKLYPTSSKELNEILEQNFDKKDLIGEVTERIKTPDDAVSEYISIHGDLPLLWQAILAYTGHERRLQATKANVLLDIIEVVLNEGWEAEHVSGKYRHFPLFEKHGSAFAFLYSYSLYGNADSYVGSRREFKTEKLSDYFGKQFIDLHNLAFLKK